jgi:hypothetical protein
MNKIKFIVGCLALFFAGNVGAQTLSASDINIEPGGEATLEISIDSPVLPASGQFNLVLPEGLSLKVNNKGKIAGTKKGDAFADVTDDEDTHTIQITPKEGGVYFVLAYDPDGGEFQATSGVVMTVQVVADEGTSGSLTCDLKDIKFVDKDAKTVGTFANSTFNVTVGDATGINSISFDDPNAEIYNLNGQRVNNVKKGVYIVNGKKAIVK